MKEPKPYDKDLNPTKEGLFDIPESTYRKIKALNITYAKLFNRSALHVWTAINDPKSELITPSYAMKQGTAFHWCALEPSRFESEVVAESDLHKNSKDYKKWAAENADKLIVKPEDIVNVRKMVKVMRSKKSVAGYLSGGWSEKSILWYEDEFKIWCKGRIDWIRTDGQAVIDLKKTQVASRYAFELAIRRYEYNIQGAHYMRGYSKVMGYRPREWVWIVSEIEPPNECNVFVADPIEIDSAEVNLEYWYGRYATSLETGHWPGYPDEPIYLGGNEPVGEITNDEFSHF
jgi:hypothetical protein